MNSTAGASRGNLPDHAGHLAAYPKTAKSPQ